MEKISSGCDIAFVICGDEKNPIRMGSTLSPDWISYEAIARFLQKDQNIKSLLRDKLKYETSTIQVSKEDFENKGIVHNSIVKVLVDKYSYLDWDNVDQSTKILAVNKFAYFGESMSNQIIKQYNHGKLEKIFIIDPRNPEQVEQLNSYLVAQSKLNNQTEEIQELINTSDLKLIIEQLKESVKRAGIEDFKFNPKNEVELIQDFMDNKLLFQKLTYKVNDRLRSVNSELNRILRALEGKREFSTTYLDIFANEIVSRSKYDKVRNSSKIPSYSFFEALQIKLQDLKSKEKPSENETILIEEIQKFLSLQNKEFQDYKNIVDLLIKSSDDEFSYALDSYNKGILYFKNVPRVLEQTYKDFTYKSIEVLKPSGEPYKGYTIYISPNGEYYYSRHILTTKSYGRKYKSRQECIDKIDNIIKLSPINQQSLIELKTRGEQSVVYLPNKFLPGQIIKSLNIKFSKGIRLNKTEYDLIYNSGINNSNTLNKFYNYILGITDSESKEYLSNQLKKVIDTAEKVVCFIYMLNEQEGDDRKPLTFNKIQSIISEIQKKENDYEYFVVEEVGDTFTQLIKPGIKIYNTTSLDKQKNIQNTPKKVRKHVLTQIQPAEINNSIISHDKETGRLLPTIRLLKDLANKIQNKLGVTVHVETQSDLETLFESWGQKFTEDIKGFVRNGEIYINSSNASVSDLFHEYSHIMLGVLKAKNYDNYVDLVNIVANSKDAKYIRKSLLEKYSNLAQQDLNEEVFAEMFGQYISGKNFEEFLDGTLKSIKQAVDNNLKSIFGKQKLTDDFYNTSVKNIFSQFGYDLSILMKEGNGLELQPGNTYRQASTWIEGQIKKYKDTGEIGIYEKCD